VVRSADMLRLLRPAILAACSTLALACPDAAKTSPVAKCTKAYEQCALAQGLLGVCDPVECNDGQPGPCLICRPQH
jgi:hypothetical protein